MANETFEKRSQGDKPDSDTDQRNQAPTTSELKLGKRRENPYSGEGDREPLSVPRRDSPQVPSMLEGREEIKVPIEQEELPEEEVSSEEELTEREELTNGSLNIKERLLTDESNSSYNGDAFSMLQP